MNSNGALGRRGEEIALGFLAERGCKFVARNWRCSHIELDIIVEDQTHLRIVEVKTPYSTPIRPVESIEQEKRRRIIRATDSFVRRYNIEKEVVFDIISIIHDKEGYKIEYTPDAFNILTNK